MSESKPNWKPGYRSGTVVSKTACAAEHSPVIATNHNDTGYYGGYLVAESVPPELVPLIAAAPDLLAACKAHQAAEDHYDTCEDCGHEGWCTAGESLYMQAIDLRKAALAKAEEVPS